MNTDKIVAEKIASNYAPKGGNKLTALKKLEDIVVTLPFADGTSADFGVYSYFEVNNKKYFALLPLKGEKELDFSQSYMLYEVEEDEEHNPIVMYIEDDLEYAIAAQYFSKLL